MYETRDREIVWEGYETQNVAFIRQWMADLSVVAPHPAGLVLINVNDRMNGLPAVVGVRHESSPTGAEVAGEILAAAIADANGHRDRQVGYQLCVAQAADPSEPDATKPRLSITIDRDGKSCFCPPRNAEVKAVTAIEPCAEPPHPAG